MSVQFLRLYDCHHTERRGYVMAGPFTPEVVVQHPEAVRQLSREYGRAGANVIQVKKDH